MVSSGFSGSAQADDATLQELDRVREQQAAFREQQTELEQQADLSADGLRDAEAALTKQRALIAAASQRLQGIADQAAKLKQQRGVAMQESYRTTDEDSYLYALASSGSLTEFLRRGQYTDLLVSKKDQVLELVDRSLDELDRQRQDLLTQHNTADTTVLNLQKRIAEIERALADNAAGSEAARSRESYLVGLTGDYTKGGCHRVGGDETGGPFTFTGSGTEHGLGMSQYGAKGAAERGKNHREILSHYYRGTAIGQVGSFQTNQGESEGYLVGVVEAEVNTNWPMEALKAQAVAARSYAYQNRNGLDNTPATQAWVGPSQQTERARQAVRETAGQVVTHQGQVVAAYYHSTSGGCTEHNENVWGGRPLAWLRGTASPWETDSPHWNWQTATYSREQMQGILNADGRTNVGTLQSVKIIGRGVSGRVTAVQVTGSAGTKTVSGPTFKKIFNNHSPASERGLRSTLFGFN